MPLIVGAVLVVVVTAAVTVRLFEAFDKQLVTLIALAVTTWPAENERPDIVHEVPLATVDPRFVPSA